MAIDMTKPLKSYSTVLLETIQEHAPVSKRRLQELTGFSWGLVSRITNELAEKQYIVPIGKVDTGVGRKPDEYDINPGANYSIGVDFSSAGAVIAVTDMKGRIVEKYGLTWKKREKESVLNQFLEMMDVIMEQYGDYNMVGVGFAVQGVVNVTSGVSVYMGSVEGWNDVPLKQIIEDRYEVGTVVAHDPDCLMRCERALGLLKNSQATDVVLVHYIQGASIGMSVMLDGRLYMGHHEKANEIGHTILGKMFNGRYDFLDNHISKQCMEEDYRNLSVKGESLPYQEIVRRAKEGDALAKKVFDHLYEYMGQSIAIVNSYLNPEVLILHTVGCDFGETLYHKVDDYLRTVSYDKEVDFRFSELGSEAKAIGASIMAVDRWIGELT